MPFLENRKRSNPRQVSKRSKRAGNSKKHLSDWGTPPSLVQMPRRSRGPSCKVIVVNGQDGVETGILRESCGGMVEDVVDSWVRHKSDSG
jgi:hypothetical protein